MKKSLWKETKRHLMGLLIAAFIIFFAITIHVAFNGGINKVIMKTYTLSNGEKTVVYQSMIHLGLKSFYKEVADDIEHYREEGYAIFFEGIGASDETPLTENDEGYEKAVYFFNLKKEYYSKIYITPFHEELKDSPYTLQAYEFIDSYKYGDKVSDFSYDVLTKKIRESLDIDTKTTQTTSINKVLDSNNLVNNKSKLTSLLSSLFQEISHADNFRRFCEHPSLFIYLTNASNFFLFEFFADYIDPVTKHFIPSLKIKTDVILTARTQHLVNDILDSKNNKIYVSYGEGHFKGVLKELKEKDSNWKIINISEKIAISQ